MTLMTIKAQVNSLYQDRPDGPVALSLGAVGEDGANDAWAGASGPEVSFRLDLTTRGDVVEQLGLRTGQRVTLTLDLDDRHAVVAPPETTEVDDRSYTVAHPDTGELTQVSAAEARDRGYETGVGGASGLAVGPQQHAPVLSLPEEQIDAQTGQPVYDETGHQGYDARQAGRESDAYGSTPDAPAADRPHGEVHGPDDERPADEPVVDSESHVGTAAEHDEHRDASA